MTAEVVLAPTATKLPDGAAGGVVISGSHGGAYAGHLIARVGARALVLNDAGVGRDEAGVGCLGYCEAFAMAAATVSHESARIGDAEDMIENGVVSRANAVALAAGVEAGMPCRAAAELLRAAPMPAGDPTPYAEARHVAGENAHGLRLVCIDSVSLVEPGDAGRIVLSGSHGGLVAGRRAMAIQVEAAAAFYNDAGIGKDGAGVSRLPVLDDRGIAAATVSAASARIGDGRSTHRDGIVSRANETARRLGIEPGMAAAVACDLVTGR